MKTLSHRFLLDRFRQGAIGGSINSTLDSLSPALFSHTGVYSLDPSVRDPPPIDTIWNGAHERFAKRARSSVRLHGSEHWAGALQQVAAGWLHAPVPFDEDGTLGRPTLHNPIGSFRFGVDQSGKLRACDDLKYSKTHEYCAARGPISLPTWGHIGQMAIPVSPALDHGPSWRPTARQLTNNAPSDPARPNWRPSLYEARP